MAPSQIRNRVKSLLKGRKLSLLPSPYYYASAAGPPVLPPPPPYSSLAPPQVDGRPPIAAETTPSSSTAKNPPTAPTSTPRSIDPEVHTPPSLSEPKRSVFDLDYEQEEVNRTSHNAFLASKRSQGESTGKAKADPRALEKKESAARQRQFSEWAIRERAAPAGQRQLSIWPLGDDRTDLVTGPVSRATGNARDWAGVADAADEGWEPDWADEGSSLLDRDPPCEEWRPDCPESCGDDDAEAVGKGKGKALQVEIEEDADLWPMILDAAKGRPD